MFRSKYSTRQSVLSVFSITVLITEKCYPIYSFTNLICRYVKLEAYLLLKYYFPKTNCREIPAKTLQQSTSHLNVSVSTYLNKQCVIPFCQSVRENDSDGIFWKSFVKLWNWHHNCVSEHFFEKCAKFNNLKRKKNYHSFDQQLLCFPLIIWVQKTNSLRWGFPEMFRFKNNPRLQDSV